MSNRYPSNGTETGGQRESLFIRLKEALEMTLMKGVDECNLDCVDGRFEPTNEGEEGDELMEDVELGSLVSMDVVMMTE
ncbi:hypothetical protein NliqN6_2778 [Naganishia liquefaciens]|uniref:Uncharacterized protein n=1 Tax=Naganishia liquefaciens TaxID=104408 RepID=A0A8H3TSW6_9TREE|nr:hypothetical protein NliqN6_2778 [Naganishia liquefaciens]